MDKVVKKRCNAFSLEVKLVTERRYECDEPTANIKLVLGSTKSTLRATCVRVEKHVKAVRLLLNS